MCHRHGPWDKTFSLVLGELVKIYRFTDNAVHDFGHGLRRDHESVGYNSAHPFIVLAPPQRLTSPTFRWFTPTLLDHAAIE